MPAKILINFASPSFGGAQKDNSNTGLSVAKFDSVIEYGFKDLDSEFSEKNKKLLQASKGAGYWMWLPYIYLDAFNKCADGDYVFYCNSGAHFVGEVQLLVEELESLDTFALLFYGYDRPLPIEKVWTRRDTFILMDCDSPEYTDTRQIFAGYLLLRNCPAAREFMKQYLAYCEDERIIADAKNVMGKPDYPGFRDHRQNQSILSLLAKKWKIPISSNLPDQFRCPQIIQYDRRRY